MKEKETTVKVWDPVVRIGHWILVVAFFTAWFTEDDFLTQHVWAGYAVALVIFIRILWGFIGSRHARFSSFLCSPVATLRYLRDMLHGRARRHIGHNPAGAAMIVALLFALGATGYSGIMIYAIEENAGPLAPWVAPEADGSRPAGSATRPGREDAGVEAREEFWEEIHEIFANLTLLLVALHVAGVLFSSYLHRENLVKAMITGRKRAAARQPSAEPEISGAALPPAAPRAKNGSSF